MTEVGVSEGEDVSKAKRFSKRLLVYLALVLAVLSPSLAVLEFRHLLLPGAENTNDAYYHIAMADQGPAYCMARQFPSLTLSIWRDRFADNTLLWHLYLWAVRHLERLCGSDMAPSFQFAAFSGCLLAFGGFVFAARRMAAPAGAIFFGAFFMTLLCANGLYRLMMVRPILLSIGLLLFSCGLYAKGGLRFKLLAAFLISFIYAWSYSNPHFIVIPAGAFGVALLWEFGPGALLLPLVSLGGVVAGLTFHPQFPNTFILWKAQCLDPIILPMLGASPTGKTPEMCAPDTLWLLLAIPFAALLYGELVLLLKWGREGVARIPAHVKALALLTLFFSLCCLLASRSIEYACPFACLLGVVLAAKFLPETLMPLKKAGAFAALALALLCALDYLALSRADMHPGWRACPKLAAWLRANVPAGTPVANLSFGEFQILFQAAPEYKYAWGLEPMFTYALSPEASKGMVDVFAKVPLDADSLRRLSGADICASVLPFYKELMSRSGWRLLYDGPDGCVFSLK